MRYFRSAIFGFAIVILSTIAASAQAPASTSTTDMKKLDFLIGEWKGGGWMQFANGQRETFRGTETVQSKLDGAVIQVEGLHYGKTPGSDKEVVVHNALGILSYDEQARLYHFHAWLANGRFTKAEVKLIDSGWQWGYSDPRGATVRFTIRVTEKGEWHEIGEVSLDGKTWRQFFDMNMQRVK